MASVPYALAQDAASAIKTFLGEVYYDPTLGIPYFQSILGQYPPFELIRSKMVAAVIKVPGVTAARVFFSGYNNRKLSGQVQVTDYAGNVAAIGF